MKNFLKLTALSTTLVLLGCATVIPPNVHAANYASVSLLNGSNAKFYNGAADGATTWDLLHDLYGTNTTYVNRGGTTVTPLSTNATTGAVVAVAAVPAPLWPNANGDLPNNVALMIRISAATEFTNTVALTLIRGSDTLGVGFSERNHWDVQGLSFAVTVTPSSTNTVTITNMPTAFLQGASHIRLWKVAAGANPLDAGNFTLHELRIAGWSP